jgi:acyl-CoA synthetase (AMP-forming)/AMP-acid ligase II
MSQHPNGGVTPVSRRVMNLAHFLTQAARRFPDAAALVIGERVLSWRELDARTSALALALSSRGITKGDRVMVHSKNSHELIETQLAAFRLGAVWVPTNYRIAPDEAAYLAKASGASVLFVQGEFGAHAKAACEAAASISLVVRIGVGDVGDIEFDALTAPFAGQPCADLDVEYDDPCWFFFTSGTTGRPKAGVLTHGQMGFVLTNHLCDLMPGTDQANDCSLVVAPLSHGAGVHYLTQLARGVTTVMPQGVRFNADEIWSLVARHRVTNMFTVPTIVKLLVEDPCVERHDHSSLRYVIYAGAPMYREDQKRALATLGNVLVQYFGLGEVTGNITVFPPALHSVADGPQDRAGTCGFPRTAMQISVQDDDGNEVPAGSTGEICVCGPAVFAGYYDNPEANAKAFRNGWFRTGDLGHVDPEGFLYITGRASDMYISGGSNVYPREIEEKMLTHPAILEVAVVGVPDRTWGETGVMVCVLRPGHQLDEPQLLEWMGTRVARYKVPRQIFFWDELPRSGYGKITKKLVREALDARGCLGDTAPS